MNASAQNMFSRDVKRLSFRCRTLKFSRPILTGICFQSTRREEIIKKASHFQVTCGIKWYNLPNIILFRKLGEDYASARAQFQISLNGATVVEVKPLLRDSEASINKCYPLLALRKSSMLFGLSIYIRRNFL